MIGSPLTREVDVLMQDGIVQAKSPFARHIISQIQKTIRTTGIPTIGYVPGLSARVLRQAALDNVQIATTIPDLLALVAEKFGG